MKLTCILLISLFLILGCSSKPENNDLKNPDNNKSSVQIDAKAVDFLLKDTNGNAIKLSDFNGKKYVMIVFWATWCPYCKKEVPVLNELADYFKGNDFEIIGINIQESEKLVKEYAVKLMIKYNLLLDSDGNVAKNYNVLGIPLNIIVDKSGDIVYSSNSLPDKPKKYIENLLKALK